MNCSRYLIMVDAPQSSLVLITVARSKLVMQLTGKLGCIPAECLADPGAGLDVLNQQFAEKNRLSVDKLANVSQFARWRVQSCRGPAKYVSESKHIHVWSHFM